MFAAQSKCGMPLRGRPWLQSFLVSAATVGAALWLWFGPWLWPGIPWLVMGLLPFVIGLFVPRVPLLFAMLPLLVPIAIEGGVSAAQLLRGLGATYMAAAFGILLRRLF
ncbi:MAG: hypothetical protein JWN15_2321 [Firmicutes bacterium]|nr:hypothetical protein [Bacillota bacterium]